MEKSFPNFLLPILLKLAILGGVSGVAKNYHDILDSLQFPDKFVFDISKPISHQFSSENFTFLDPERLKELGVQLSPLLYFQTERIYDNQTDLAQSNILYKRLKRWLNIHPDSVSFLLERNANQSVRSESGLTGTGFISDDIDNNRMDTVIINIHDWFPRISNWTLKNLKAAAYMLKTQLKDVKLGFETKAQTYQERFNLNRYFGLMNDVIILNIDIPPEKFFLSYSLFKKNLQETIDTNLEYIETSAETKIYIKLNFPENQERNETQLVLSEKQYQRYYFYLLQFSVFWINEGRNGTLIVPTFNRSLAFQEVFHGVELKKLWVTSMDINSIPMDAEACGIKTLLDHVSDNFKSVYVDMEVLSWISEIDRCILTNDPWCSENEIESKVCNRPNGYSSLPDINTRSNFYSFHDVEFSTKLHNLKNKLHGLPWKLHEVNTWKGKPTCIDSIPMLIQEMEQLPPNVIRTSSFDFKVQGYKNFTQKDYDLRLPSKCGLLLRNQSKAIIWKVNLSLLFDAYDLTMKMLVVLDRRQKALKIFPEKSIMLRVRLRMQYVGPYYPEPHQTEYIYSFYCHPEDDKERVTATANEQAEVVMNFSKIFNVSIELEEFLDDPYELRKPIETFDGLNLTKTKFPVFVARNYPERFLLGEMQTDPCISWTETVPPTGIQIDENFGGTSIYMKGMKNGTLTEKDFQVMLMLTLHKFTLVEIIPFSDSDLNTVLTILSKPTLIAQLQVNGIDMLKSRIFIQVDCEIELMQFSRKFKKMVLKPAGVHVSNCDHRVSLASDHLLKFKSEGIALGMYLNDCVNEVNSQFGNVRKSSLVDQLDYVFCNIEQPTEATNINYIRSAKYLDSLLYIQKYFDRMFSEKDMNMYFRLNTVPQPTKSDTFYTVTLPDNEKEMNVSRNGTSSFLTYFSDVSQYGSLYKLKLFMFPAFDNMEGSQFGWWTISDFHNLTNTSIYTERESEFLGRKIWRPVVFPDPQMNPEINPESNVFSLLIIAMTLFCGVLIISILLLRIWYRKRYALLTKTEVDNFRYGRVDSESGEMQSFDGKEFPKEFQIPRNNFVLETKIGQGQFGLVYRATLCFREWGSTIVAVKMPHPDCSKEYFKTMLSELKVLCFVGTHQYVLHFVGAYIKEIGRGRVYIATELCENGALLHHLQNLESRLSREAGDKDVKMSNGDRSELSRFAYEIALGMEYIASKNIIHGDLATRNVLLDSHLKCKIADFGLSRILYESEEYIKTGTEPMPWRWLAVESLRRNEFTTKTDVWSYGITIWEIFDLGSVPYPGRSFADGFLEALENGLRMTSPTYATDAIFQEMTHCWDADPSERPTFTELSQFFGSLKNSEYTPI